MSWVQECGQHWLLRQLQAHELQVGLPVLVQAHLSAASRTATSRSGPSATSNGHVSLPYTARRQNILLVCTVIYGTRKQERRRGARIKHSVFSAAESRSTRAASAVSAKMSRQTIRLTMFVIVAITAIGNEMLLHTMCLALDIQNRLVLSCLFCLLALTPRAARCQSWPALEASCGPARHGDSARAPCGNVSAAALPSLSCPLVCTRCCTCSQPSAASLTIR